MTNIDRVGLQEALIAMSDDKRHKQVTTIIALAALFLMLMSFLTIPYYSYTSPEETLMETFAYKGAQQVMISNSVGVLFSIAVLLVLRFTNRVTFAGILLTIGISLSIVLSDDLVNIAGGYSTIFLTVPILIASITIRPYATFLVSFLTTVLLLNRPGGDMKVNLYAIIAFWMLSLCAWLATSIMEKAIHSAQQDTFRVRSMIGIVSHELRTPLGTISGFSDMLMLGDPLTDEQARMLKKIKTSTITLVELVNRILDFAQIQSGRMVLRPAEINPHDLVNSVVDESSKKAFDKGLEFHSDVQGLPLTIKVDPMRFRQILTNLLENAIKFTERGEVKLSVKGSVEWITVDVSDTGKGIAEADIKELFQEFAQAQHFATREYGGVGLGLSIIHHLVEAMKGKITVTSQIGSGSTFTVMIPMKG